MTEDSFEKARKVFFGTVTATAKPGVAPAEFLKPRSQAASEQPSPDPREARAFEFR
jgi:hypothetical protein